MYRIAAALSLLAFAAALAQAVLGIGFWKVIPMEGEKAIREDEGYAVRFRLDEKYGRPLDDARGFVIEDGVRTGRRAGSNAVVRDHGYGWFKILRRNVRFSSTDGTDPRTNGRSYAVIVPREVPPAVLFGLLALAGVFIYFAFKRGEPMPRAPDINPVGGRAGLTVFVAGSVVAGILMYLGSGFTDQGLVFKGMPYSDSLGWNEMAIGLADGRGFTTEFFTHRPFYSVFVGGFYYLFGPYYILAKLVNIFSAGLLAASGYLFVARAFKSVPAGAIMALFLVLAPGHFKLLQVTATEQLGLALTVFSLYLTWVAILSGKSMTFLAAGIFLGLSNLTRTFTVLSFPIYGLILIVFCIYSKSGWKSFLRQSVIFGGGVLLVFGPWLARQTSSYGITSISSNSADMLYGAAAYGRWDSRQYEEATEAGIEDSNPARYPFFRKRFNEVIAEDPGRYYSFVGARFVEYLGDSFNPGSPEFRLAIGLVVLFAALRLCWRRRSAEGLIVLAALLPLLGFLLKSDVITFQLQVADTASNEVPVPLIDSEKPTPGGGLVLLLVMLPLAFFPLVKGRVIAVSLLLATLLGSGLLSAMVGNFGLSRTDAFGGWVYVAIAFAGITGLFHLIEVALERWRPLKEGNESASESEQFELERFSRAAAISLVAISLVAVGLLYSAYAFRGGESDPRWALNPKDADKLLDWGKSEFASEIAENPDKELSVYPVFLGDYRADLDANEDLATWSVLFKRTEYPRTVAKVRTGVDPEISRMGAGLLPVHFPGGIPAHISRWERYALVGLKELHFVPGSKQPGREPFDITALALVPLAQDMSPDFDRSSLFKAEWK